MRADEPALRIALAPLRAMLALVGLVHALPQRGWKAEPVLVHRHRMTRRQHTLAYLHVVKTKALVEHRRQPAQRARHAALAHRVEDAEIGDLRRLLRLDARAIRGPLALAIARAEIAPCALIVFQFEPGGLSSGVRAIEPERVPCFLGMHAADNTRAPDQPRKAARAERAAAESEHVDLVAILIVEGQPQVGLDDVVFQPFAENAAKDAVQPFAEPVQEPVLA